VDNKKIIELILWVFISISMFVFTIGFALSSTFFVLIAPVPFMLITRRYGHKIAFLSAFIASGIVFFLLDPVASLMFALLFCLTGIAFGVISVKVKSASDYMLAAILASLFSKMILVVIFSKIIGVNPFVIDADATSGIISSVIKVFPKVGAQLSVSSIEEQIKTMANNLSLLMPAMLILFSAMDSLASYYCSSYIIKRLKYVPLVKMPPFSEWRCPQNIFWALFASLIIDLTSRAYPEVRQLTVISVNLLEILRAVFIVQGLSLAWYFMTLRKVHRVLKVMFVILSIIFAPLSYILYIVGIFDICYDLRKLIRRKMK